MKNGNESYFQIDWYDYKKILKETIINGNAPTLNNATTTRSFKEHVTSAGSWKGFTTGQLQRWISEGYTPPGMIDGMKNLIPPIREKRRTIWHEDGDEFHVDRAISGDDNFISMQSKREVIPGLKVEAGIMFAAMVSADVVNAYTVWLCKVMYSLEMSGIDAQLTLDFPSWQGVNDQGHKAAGSSGATCYHSLIRVKRENEISDFKSWSAMISPAALRNFGFGAICLHANEIKGTPSGSMGRGVPERRDWEIIWDSARRVMVISNAYVARDFNESAMTAKLKTALAGMRGKA
jgi:hypothetical protein